MGVVATRWYYNYRDVIMDFSHRLTWGKEMSVNQRVIVFKLNKIPSMNTVISLIPIIKVLKF